MFREILYEDSEIKVIWQSGTSDFLLITFGDLVSLASGDKFYADNPVTKLNLNCIGFMAKKPNWFPSENMKAAIGHIQIMSQFTSRIAYGGSMGGYAAIKYSALLGATEVIAFCPQWSIDPKECVGKKNGYESKFKPSMAAMGIRKEDISGKICIFYDPSHEVDSFHFNQITALCENFISVKVYMAGHHITAILAGTSNLFAIIESVRLSDIERLKDIVNLSRRKSRYRKLTLLQRAMNRHPMLTHKLLMNNELVADIGVKTWDALNARLFSFFISHENFREAYEVIDRLSRLVCKQRADLLQEAVVDAERKAVIKAYGFLFTHHKTILVYSPYLGKLCHIDSVTLKAKNMEFYPLFLTKQYNFEILAVWVRGIFYACCIEDNNQINLKELQLCQGDNSIIVKADEFDDGFTLLRKGCYLSAVKNGQVAYNRTCPLTWEIFFHA